MNTHYVRKMRRKMRYFSLLEQVIFSSHTNKYVVPFLASAIRTNL
uniref:Uncharacterized protein n=1 Tax=Kuenenia stuttgartiensis TaxID=174633 RepID=Q1PWN5_KUEST|nr:unknown protein [Candidatus Kuenenia stuttgartiensis]